MSEALKRVEKQLFGKRVPTTLVGLQWREFKKSIRKTKAQMSDAQLVSGFTHAILKMA